MRPDAMPSNRRSMDSSTGFGTTRLLRTDARLAFAVLNHLRYQTMNSLFGVSREQRTCSPPPCW
jgi:hypothetical protein